MFENVDGQTDDGVTGILLAHPRAFGSGELKTVLFIKDSDKMARFQSSIKAVSSCTFLFIKG